MIRDDLRAALVQAMKRRDHDAVGVLRTTLAAIDNAEAAPLSDSDRAGAIEHSVVGVGRTDVPRRLLTEQDIVDVVAREAAELRTVAGSLSRSRPETARRLLHHAALLQAVMDEQATPQP